MKAAAAVSKSVKPTQAASAIHTGPGPPSHTVEQAFTEANMVTQQTSAQPTLAAQTAASESAEGRGSRVKWLTVRKLPRAKDDAFKAAKQGLHSTADRLLATGTAVDIPARGSGTAAEQGQLQDPQKPHSPPSAEVTDVSADGAFNAQEAQTFEAPGITAASMATAATMTASATQGVDVTASAAAQASAEAATSHADQHVSKLSATEANQPQGMTSRTTFLTSNPCSSS